MSETTTVARTEFNGVALTSAMTPTERFNAIAKSMGAPEYKPQSIPFGPQGHPHVVTDTAQTAREMTQQTGGSAFARNPPPDPKTLEASRRAELDAIAADIGARSGKPAAPTPQGYTMLPDGRRVAATEIDHEGIAKLNAKFQEVMRDLERAGPSVDTTRTKEKIRTQYNEELAEFYEGRKLGEKRSEFQARMKGGPAAPVSQHTPEQWTEGHKSVTDKDGWMPLERINKDGLSGYTLPKLIDGQFYHKSVFAELAAARAANVSQEQVNAFIKAQMVRDGWVKA
jgi:hypothetical protein